MDPGPAGTALRAPAQTLPDPAEGLEHRVRLEVVGPLGAKQPARGTDTDPGVTHGQVALERDNGGGVQRHEPGLAELGQRHREHTGVQVDIGAVESAGLAQPQPRACQQPEQRDVGGRP